MFPEFRLEAVAAHYEQMQPMLFGTVPTFDEVCKNIIDLEARINAGT